MTDRPASSNDPPTRQGAAPRPAPSSPTPRQRWRLVIARDEAAGGQTQREVAEAWEAAIAGAGLPVARGEGPSVRPRISFGAPLPVGMAAEGELIDIVLTERWPIWRVREALSPFVPPGWRLVRLEDVWPAGPPLAGRVAAADYRIELAADEATAAGRAADIARACAHLLAADRLERDRAKGAGIVRYDLRPLLLDARVVDSGPPIIVRARTRIHPELGSGRPEEVVAALADADDRPITPLRIVRERLILAEDLDEERFESRSG